MAVLAAGCGASEADELLGSRFGSTEVEQSSEPRKLVDGPIEVEFEDRGDGEPVVRWEAGCNVVGGRFEISGDRLRPRAAEDGPPDFDSTAVGCTEEAQAQDAWLAGVFASEPSWALEDDTLVLSTGDAQIQLERQ